MAEDMEILEAVQEELDRERTQTEETLRSSLSELETNLRKQFAAELRTSSSAILAGVQEVRGQVTQTGQSLARELRKRDAAWTVGWIVALCMFLLMVEIAVKTWDWKERLLPESVYIKLTKDNALYIQLPQAPVEVDPKRKYIIIRR